MLTTFTAQSHGMFTLEVLYMLVAGLFFLLSVWFPSRKKKVTPEFRRLTQNSTLIVLNFFVKTCQAIIPHVDELFELLNQHKGSVDHTSGWKDASNLAHVL